MTKIITTARLTKTAAAAFCALALTTAYSLPAHAATDGAQIKVEYSDLDLSTQAGRARLENRINAAASTACGESNGVVSMRERQQINQCRTQAKAKAFASVEALKVERLAAK